MRKKNQKSSVPNGMHSLAQRSRQERQQKIEDQQRTRAAAIQQNGEMAQHVPEAAPTYYGKKPMKQVPPPSVQKPEKPISQAALEQLKQQVRRHPADGVPLKPMEFYDHFFAEVPTQPDVKPVQAAPSSQSMTEPSSQPIITPDMLRQIAELAQQADGTPKTVSLQTGRTAAAESPESVPRAHSTRDARTMPKVPTAVPKKQTQIPSLQPETTEQPSQTMITPDMLQQIAELAQQADGTPKTVSLQTGRTAAAESPESVSKARSTRDARTMPQMPTAVPKAQEKFQSLQPETTEQSSQPVITPDMLRQIAEFAQQADGMPKTVSLQTGRTAAAESPESVPKARPAHKPRTMPQMPTAVPNQPLQSVPQSQSSQSEAMEDSPFITTAMLRQMAAAGETPIPLRSEQSTEKNDKQAVRFYGKPDPKTVSPAEQRQPPRPAKPRDIALETAVPSEPMERFVEEAPQIAEKRTKYLKNRHPKSSVAELTGTAEKKPHSSFGSTSKARKFFEELFVEDSPRDAEPSNAQKPEVSVQTAFPDAVPNGENDTWIPPESQAGVAYAVEEAPVQPKKRPVISHAAEEAPVQPKKRSVVSHAAEEPEQAPLESAAFYERLFHDFPEQPENTIPTAEEIAQQQRKEAVIASVKGAVSAAEQGKPVKKQMSKRAYMQQKAERFAMTIGISVMGGIVFVLAAILLIVPRSTISYEENRVLAEKPKFSLTALLDGSYTAGLAEYYNDTVPFRSKLKKTISSMMQWTGIQDEEDTVFFGNVQQIRKNRTVPAVTTTEAVTTAAEEGNVGTAETVLTTTEDPNDEPAAEIGEGIILDHKRAICVYGGSFSTGQDYAENLNAYQEALGDDVQVYSMVVPTAVSYYLPEAYADYTASETENIDHINSYLNDVKPIDAYAALEPHKAEAIYARTDHHWLPLGAYYAAEAFATVADVPFAPLSDYDIATKTDYVGSMYTYTESAVLLEHPEEFTYYIPKNHYTTTYYSTSFTDPQEGDLLVNIDDYDQSMYYLVFMNGDDKITHVETDCKNGRTLVIFKDSYGNALVPCLTQSFENIYVCDIRYFDLNAIDFCEEVDCTDLLFAMNTYSATGGNESYLESNLLQ